MTIPPPQLRPPFKSGEEAREMGRKGGLSRSPKKSIAAKIRCLREKDLSDDYSKYLCESIMDSDFDIVDQKHFLNKLVDNCPDERSKREVMKLWLDWHKVHHGSKEKLGGDVNVQINVVEQLSKFYREVNEKKEIVVEVKE